MRIRFGTPSLTFRRLGPGGFSMLELVVVLALISLLGAIVLPRFSSAVVRDHPTRAADRIASDMNFARMLAVRTASPVEVQFVQRGYDVFEEGNATPQREVRFGRNYGNATIDADPATFRFNSRGMLLDIDDPSGGAACPRVLIEGPDGSTVQLVPTATGRFVQGDCF